MVLRKGGGWIFIWHIVKNLPYRFWTSRLVDVGLKILKGFAVMDGLGCDGAIHLT